VIWSAKSRNANNGACCTTIYLTATISLKSELMRNISQFHSTRIGAISHFKRKIMFWYEIFRIYGKLLSDDNNFFLPTDLVLFLFSVICYVTVQHLPLLMNMNVLKRRLIGIRWRGWFRSQS